MSGPFYLCPHFPLRSLRSSFSLTTLFLSFSFFHYPISNVNSFSLSICATLFFCTAFITISILQIYKLCEGQDLRVSVHFLDLQHGTTPGTE